MILAINGAILVGIGAFLAGLGSALSGLAALRLAHKNGEQDAEKLASDSQTSAATAQRLAQRSAIQDIQERQE
jgi:hypothetical protein